MLYNGYKAKYEQLKGKRNNDIGYVSERVVVKWMIELLEKILNDDIIVKGKIKKKVIK